MEDSCLWCSFQFLLAKLGQGDLPVSLAILHQFTMRTFPDDPPLFQNDDLLGISDLLLLPSQTESFGLVALEAMACEVPVIVSDVGGLPEVITDGVEGYLVDSADLKKMAERAISILSDDAARKAMGVRARVSARSRFCSTKIIPQYEEFYRKVISFSVPKIATT
jgi:glycogen synthase